MHTMPTHHAPFYIRVICLLLLIISLFLGYLVYHDKSEKNKATEQEKLGQHPGKQPNHARLNSYTEEKTTPPLPLLPPKPITPPAKKTHINKNKQTKQPKPSPTASLGSTTHNQPSEHVEKKQRSSTHSAYKNTGKPQIAIIIDDIGYGKTLGQQFIDLPYPLSYAFIPFSPYGEKLAAQAHKRNKLVMLHAPMATIHHGNKWEDSLHPSMTESHINNMLDKMLLNIPHAQGVNNHGGSLFTQSDEKMTTVFNNLKKRTLFFVDSRTSTQTVGLNIARHTGLAFAERDVFLDNSKDKNDINVQIDTLIATAKKQGYAIGIAHPYMETYTVLKQRLNRLELNGIELVPVSLLVH